MKRFVRYFPCIVLLIGLMYLTIYIYGVPQIMPHRNQLGLMDIRPFQSLEDRINGSTSPMLILFTTWSSLNEEGDLQIHINTLKVWASLKPYIQPVVFTNITEISVMANAAGWYTLPLGQTSCNGVPVLRDMFETIFRFTNVQLAGYANSDILFNPGLIYSVIGLLDSVDIQRQSILMIGKRIDISIDKFKDKIVTDAAEIDRFINKNSRLSWDYAEDYFITNRKFPWNDVPDLVVGRPVFDNWMIDYARNKHVQVIDATSTVNAIHQTTENSKRKGSSDLCNKELLQKLKLLPRYPIRYGQIVCATHQTIYSYKNEIQIILKKFLTYECGQRDNAAGAPIPLGK